METIVPASLRGGCPDQQALADFGLGKLPEPMLDLIGAHLSSCEPCQDALSRLEAESGADDLVALIRGYFHGGPAESDPACRELAARAEALADLPRLGTTLGASSAGGEVLADTEPMVEQWVGPYRLCGKLGQGGMGVVYRARQVSLERMVALKMILSGRHADVQAVARFHLEGKAIARLRHPNVVQVYELGEFQGQPYYTMELVEGGSLVRRLARGPLEMREAAELVRTLARAADEAHRAGVVHRDLKPANILLAEDGTPKIGDFGLAKLLDTEPNGSNTPSLTETGTVLGTANYMAPEQLDGRSGEIASATDVYALGAILYETLTGRPPFAAKTKLEVLELVRSAAPAPPSKVCAGIPFWLESICLKCLEKRPERRYPTAQALADDLDCWLRDERPQGAPGWLRRSGRAARRHRAVLVAAVAIAVLGVVWARNDPSRPLREIEFALAGGKAETLIGATGKPRWMQVRYGATQSQTSLAHDSTFNVVTFAQCLIELLPDPQSTRYRLTAQVRHDRGEPTSEVGLYVARKAYQGNRSTIDYLPVLSFNGVRFTAEHLALIPGANAHKRPPVANLVKLTPRLYSDELLPRNDAIWFPGVSGPRFQPFGEQNDRWIDLEIVVTPEKITARWDGTPFSGDIADLERRTHKTLGDSPPRRGGPVPQDLRPKFDVRGGLGLYVRRGSASFRAVRVQPL